MPILDFWPKTPHSVLLLILLLGLRGAASQGDLKVIQPEKSIQVTAGEAATLKCTVTSLLPVGPIEWFKGVGQSRVVIYRFTNEHFPRVTNTADTSKRNNLEFTIRISNVTLADEGTYYCVKFQKSGSDKEIQTGGGTELFVRVPPTLEMIHHLTAWNQLNISCLVKNFYPLRLQVTWLENGNMLQTEAASSLTENRNGTYSMTSWLLLNSTENKVLTCQVEHDGQLAVTRFQTLVVPVHYKEQGVKLLVPLLLVPKLLLMSVVSVIYIHRKQKA